MKTTVVLVALAAFYCLSSSYAQGPLWVQTNGPSGDYVDAMACDSTGGVYLGSSSILRSTNQGTTWENLTGVSLDLRYDGIRVIAVRKTGEIVAGSDNNLYLSDTSGHHWKRIFHSIGSLAIGLNGDIFASTGLTLFHTSNNGIAWDSTLIGPYLPNAQPNGQLFRSSKGTLFFYGDEEIGDNSSILFRSIDLGKNWSRIINGISALPRLSGMAEDIHGKLFLVCRTGLYGSIDNGRTWNFEESISVKDNRFPGPIAVDHSGAVLINFQHQIFFSDSSVAPIILADSEPYSSGAIADNQGRLFFSYGGQLATINHPKESVWTIRSAPTGSVGFVNVLADGSIISETRHLWSSSDTGTTWIRSDNPYGPISASTIDSSGQLIAGTQQYSPYQPEILRKLVGTQEWVAGPQLLSNVNCAITAPNGTVFIGTLREGIFRSTDLGQTWDNLNVGLTDFEIISIAVAPSADLYVTTSTGLFTSSSLGDLWIHDTTPTIFGKAKVVVNTHGEVIISCDTGKIFISDDRGHSWNKTSFPVSRVIVNDFLSTPSGHVFAATDSGIFYLLPSSKTWLPANLGLTSNRFLTLGRTKDGILLAGSANSGLFRSTEKYNSPVGSVRISNSMTSASAINSVYPNPIATSAMVTFSVPSASVARVELLNALGEVVKVVAEENVAAGSYQAPLDASDLANGVYHLRLITSEGVKMQNVVVVK